MNGRRNSFVLASRSCKIFGRYFCALALAFLFLDTSPAKADLIVPAGGLTTVNGGTVDLACTDLIVAGTLQIASGSVINVRNVTIQPGGVIDGGSGLIVLGGNWSNSGSFLAGSGSVRFRDLCSLASATVAGSTTFSNLSFVSASGKSYLFAVGSTQTVTGVLEIAGTAAQPIQFRSTQPGQVANIDLMATGTQQIQHVGVSDVAATGQRLAGFGAFNGAEPIPALDAPFVILLAALLAALGGWRTRMPGRAVRNFRNGNRLD